jgi:signal transduction histidine kinase
MLATASRPLRKYWLELVWVGFALANVTFMFFVTQWETIPFHNVWVSLALLFCVRQWSRLFTATILVAALIAVTAALTYVVASPNGPGFDELAEIPMMSAMFLVIVLFSWRRQRAVDALRRARARERDFIRDVSHYLRTPITVALGHAELIRADSTDEQLTEDAEIVVDEVRRIATISERLLLLATPEADLVREYTDVDLGGLVEATAKRWSATAARDWRVDVQAQGVVFADEERVILALDCLVENAVRATHNGDTIAIASRSDEGRAILEVSDTGEGISVVDQERIFERFQRVASNGSSKSGSGLGLALAKAIAEAHGGSLDVQSNPGDGATFRLHLGPVYPLESGAAHDSLLTGNALEEPVGSVS